MKTLIASIGLPTSGKTTTLKKIQSALNCPYISEGVIKREMMGVPFDIDSLKDEKIRDASYKTSIDQAIKLLKSNELVLLDASFHMVSRRRMLYETIKKSNCSVQLIWIYCFCDDMDTIIERLSKRKEAVVQDAFNQASSMDIFEYNKKGFEPLSALEIQGFDSVSVISNDTYNNRISETTCSNRKEGLNTERLKEIIYG